MPITSVDIDRDALTLTVVADFPVPQQRLWDAYADPKQLQRLWGPPAYPAMFTRHDMFIGGRSHYSMTGPEGDVHHGYWEFVGGRAPDFFEVLDGFASAEGVPDDALPATRIRFQFEATTTGSRLVTSSTFSSPEELDQLLGMGMDGGMREAMGQIEAVLADDAQRAGLPTQEEILDDQRIRTSRVVSGPLEAVWEAHHDEAAVAAWLTGPDGWSMPECTPASKVGERFRYLWRHDDSGAQFAVSGEVLEALAPRREVTTERMAGDGIPDGAPETINELTLIPLGDGTLITIVITYPDAETRDAVLGTGMVDGMELSYQRLDRLLDR